jgi:hypothetical protein
MISLILPTHKLRLELHVTLSPLSVEIEEFIIIAFEKKYKYCSFQRIFMSTTSFQFRASDFLFA